MKMHTKRSDPFQVKILWNYCTYIHFTMNSSATERVGVWGGREFESEMNEEHEKKE